MRRVILSSETFCHLLDLGQLQRLVEPYDLRCICYLRRQDHLLQAIYSERVKNTTALAITLDEFRHQREVIRYLDFEKKLSLWRDFCGAENLTIRPYERAQLPDGIFADFFRAVGLSLTSDYILLPANKPINPSLPPEMIELVRRFNAIKLDINLRKRLIEFAFKYLKMIGGRRLFDRYRLLSPRESFELLQRYDPGNRRVASEYLGRPDGQLFDEPWPDPAEPWQPITLDSELLQPILSSLQQQLPALRPALKELCGHHPPDENDLTPDLLSNWQPEQGCRLLFDADFYCAQYSDVAAAGVNPLAHYLYYGGAEGRNPHPVFDPGYYIVLGGLSSFPAG